MLVLSRKRGERLIIDGDIEVVVVKIEAGRVRLGFNAPPEVPIRREEIERRDREADRLDSSGGSDAVGRCAVHPE